MARTRSLNAINREAARKRYEQDASEQAASSAEPQWAEVSAVLDEAMGRLPDKLREPLMLHYLSGLTQAEVAASLGLDQSTVSRHLSQAVEALREDFSKTGVVLEVAALTAYLAKVASDPVPAAAMASIGKVALTCAASGAAGGATRAFLGSFAGKAALVAGGVAVVVLVGQNAGRVRVPSVRSSVPVPAVASSPRRDPTVLQFYILADTESRADPSGTWRITVPGAPGEGYLFERRESGSDRQARVIEAIDSAKQPEAIMGKVVRPERNRPFLDTNDILPNARARVLKEGPVVDIELTERGARVIAEVTGMHIGGHVGIFGSGRLISAPVIAEQMRVNRLQITTGSAAEADALRMRVNGEPDSQP